MIKNINLAKLLGKVKESEKSNLDQKTIAFLQMIRKNHFGKQDQ